jgi:hypothetical protein
MSPLLSTELNKIAIVLGNIDKQYNDILKQYTGKYHHGINLYRQLNNLKLTNIPNINSYFEYYDAITYKHRGKDLDDVFNQLHSNSEYIDLIDNIITEEFEVISFQTFIYFNDPNGSISDVTSIIQDRGSIIYMPNFLSTSYIFTGNTNYAFSEKVLYKIKIKNNIGLGKNWIFIDKFGTISDENEILINAGSYFVIENIDFVPMNTIEEHFTNMKMITMRLCDNLNDAIEFSKQFGETHLLYGQFDETLFTGGRKIDEIPTITSKPNYIINPYTIMINPELFDEKYKYLKNTDDIIEVYQKYYPLFEEVINKYVKKISIINREKQIYGVKHREKLPTKIGTNISNKYEYGLPQQQKNLSKLNVPGLYSELEQQMPTEMLTEIQIGGLNNKNKRQFYYKYLKYKLKYLMLNSGH